MKKIFIFVISCLLLITLFTSQINLAHAQTSDNIIYDYVFLIDVSGSMNSGSPSLFSQVKDVASNFVAQLPNGSNLSVFTFDGEVSSLGRWNSLTESTRQSIITKIRALSANGNYTALWDAICVGVDEMEKMNNSNDTHIQLLISYTDGKDNVSKNPSSACLNKYRLLQKNGYTYWIYNAIGGVDVPAELLALQDILGINRTNNPSPIRVAQFQPLVLTLGDLLKNSTKQGCTVFWLSDPSIEGKELDFSQQPITVRSLPRGTAAQICASGTSCDRKTEVTTNKVCFDFELVNLDINTLSIQDFGEYNVTLPLNTLNDDELGPIYLLPQSINFHFELIQPETPTSTPTLTKTAAPTITQEPTPTNTPEPTSTPSAAPASVRCQGKPIIDMGTIKINDDGAFTAIQTCEVAFSDKGIIMPLMVSIESENQEIISYLTLQADSQKGRVVKIDTTESELSLLLNIPADVVAGFKTGKHTFNGDLVFTGANIELLGDFKSGQNKLPLTFELSKPRSKVPYYIIGGIFVIISLISIINSTRKRNKPPQFNLIIRWTDYSSNRQQSAGLMDIVPKRVESNKFSISIGSSHLADYQIANLPDQAFSILAYKLQDSMEYYIQPKASIVLNGVETNEPFKLVSQEPFSVGEITINFLIGS
jgi:hypothetical protein